MLPGLAPSVAREADPYTVLLLHFDGANGSTSFVDSSQTSKVVTAAGNAQISTADKVFGTGSLLLDGTGDWLTIPGHDDFSFGGSDFTVDFRVRSSKTALSNTFICPNTAATAPGWWCISGNFVANGDIRVLENSNQRIAASSTSWNNNAWHHVALTRTGNVMRLFLDGSPIGSTYTTSFSYGSTTGGLIIGSRADATTQTVQGNIDELRISNISRWSANFTPPTAPYPRG